MQRRKSHRIKCHRVRRLFINRHSAHVVNLHRTHWCNNNNKNGRAPFVSVWVFLPSLSLFMNTHYTVSHHDTHTHSYSVFHAWATVWVTDNKSIISIYMRNTCHSKIKTAIETKSLIVLRAKCVDFWMLFDASNDDVLFALISCPRSIVPRTPTHLTFSFGCCLGFWVGYQFFRGVSPLTVALKAIVQVENCLTATKWNRERKNVNVQMASGERSNLVVIV